MIYLTALILGLTSNLHCIGMCGPLVMAIPIKRRTNFSLITGILQYNVGRIFTYFLLGILIGTIGLSIQTFNILQWISILSGIFLILFAWRKFFPTKLNTAFKISVVYLFITRSIGTILASESPLKLSLLGMLNGMLPCGMVYLGMLNAILTGDLFQSGLAMAIFGLGTLPSMIFAAYSAAKLTPAFRSKLNRFVPVILTFVGTLIIIRGLNLGIPYISPKIVADKTEKNTSLPKILKPEMEMSCCHKK